MIEAHVLAAFGGFALVVLVLFAFYLSEALFARWVGRVGEARVTRIIFIGYTVGVVIAAAILAVIMLVS